MTRILEHDGYGSHEGAREGWIRLGEAAGLARRALEEAEYLPGVVDAVDGYILFARRSTWIEGVAASLTQRNLPRLIEARLAAFRDHYAWVRPEGLGYFHSLKTIAKNESRTALNLVLRYATTPEDERRAVEAVARMNGVLGAMLDAIYEAYCRSG